MKKILLAISVISVSLIGYVAAGPYLTISDIKTGIIEQDSEILSENIEFPALRQNMKDQLNAVMMQNSATELKDDPFATLAIRLAATMVDGIVDAFVTPSGLSKIMEGKKPQIGKVNQTEVDKPPNKDELFKNARYSYDSISKYSIWVPNDKGEEARFILKREMLTWKLVNIIIPMDKKP